MMEREKETHRKEAKMKQRARSRRRKIAESKKKGLKGVSNPELSN